MRCIPRPICTRNKASRNDQSDRASRRATGVGDCDSSSIAMVTAGWPARCAPLGSTTRRPTIRSCASPTSPMSRNGETNRAAEP